MDDMLLDDTRGDQALLDKLHTSGPLPLDQLAEMVGRLPPEEAGRSRLSKLTGTPRAISRAQQLERRGAILGYRAVVAPDLVEPGQTAFVQVALRAMDAQTLGEFRDAVRAIPQIEACHMTAGDFNYLLKVRTPTIGAFRDLLTDRIASLPAVARTATIVAMDTVKEG